MTRRRPLLIILALLLVTAGVVGAYAWEPIYWAVMTKRIPVDYTNPAAESGGLKGYCTVHRWRAVDPESGAAYDDFTIHGVTRTWYLQSGFVAEDIHYCLSC